MKKFLQTLGKGNRECKFLQSLVLKLFVLMTLFVFSTGAVCGIGIKKNVILSSPAVESKGEFKGRIYTWNATTDNLITILGGSNSDATIDLSAYDKIAVPVSNWSGGPLKCVIRVKNGSDNPKDYTWTLYIKENATKSLNLSGKDCNFKNGDNTISNNELKNVLAVYFGGAGFDEGSKQGQVTIGQIYLTKTLNWDNEGKITFGPDDFNLDSGVTRDVNNFSFTKRYACAYLLFDGDGVDFSTIGSFNVNVSNKQNAFYDCFMEGETAHYGFNYDELKGKNITEYRLCCNDEQGGSLTLNSVTMSYKDAVIVKFDARGGSCNVSQLAYCGTPIVLPAATPKTDNLVFNAWRVKNQNDNNTSHVGNAGDEYIPESNVTLLAHYTQKGLHDTDKNGKELGDYTKTIPTNTVFTEGYEIAKNKQVEFTFNCNRINSLTNFWYGWIMWAKPATATKGNVATSPFYFWCNAQDTRYAEGSNTGIWAKSNYSKIQISANGELREMTNEEKDQYRKDMGENASVSVKVAYYDDTIRMYAVMKSSDGKRTYVQTYTYNKSAYINNADKIKVYFSVDHAYIDHFVKKEAVGLAKATYHVDATSASEDCKVTMATKEGMPLGDNTPMGLGDVVVYTAHPGFNYMFEKWGGSGVVSNPREVTVTADHVSKQIMDPTATFIQDNGHRTITVDGHNREYYIYVPESAQGKENVPVVFSLHGRGNNANPFTKGEDGKLADSGKPVFNSLADANKFIVVYPQGRDGSKNQNEYESGWNTGFSWCTGWEATGKENNDTKFIQALVDRIKSEYQSKTAENGNISVDPKRFYLCGFSMGGMMTYACAKVLNGTFAAYAATGGIPLNEFHLNLATKNPVPFYHVHGKSDTYVGYKNLHVLRQNLIARNGCCDSTVVSSSDAYRHVRYLSVLNTNSKGVTLSSNDKNADVEFVEVAGLGHAVHDNTASGMWEFFKNRTTDNLPNTSLEWKWDFATINSRIQDNNNNNNLLGWERHVETENGKDNYLEYGNNKNINCTTQDCNSGHGSNGVACNGNHNVYNSVQLKSGKHFLYVTADVAKSNDAGTVTVAIKSNKTAREIIARQVENNEGTTTTTKKIVYSFLLSEDDGEYTVTVKRSNTASKCTKLEIHNSGFTTEDKDQSRDVTSTGKLDDFLAKLDFENVTTDNLHILSDGNENNAYKETTTAERGIQLYLKNRDKTITEENKATAMKYFIVPDKIFGHYFQNIPNANIYERTGETDYIRAVLPPGALNNIKNTGEVTIGFWANAKVAVDKGLAYMDPSIFYVASTKEYNGSNENDGKKNDYMFNITGSGGISGYRVDDNGNVVLDYASGSGAFGNFCPTTQSKETDTRGNFYKQNFWIDENWHYITFQMYDGLKKYNMYIDGEPAVEAAALPGAKGSNYINSIDGLNSVVLGGLNARNCTFGYDVAFAYDDIVFYDRVLTQTDIKKIISEKHYAAGAWNFKESLKVPQIVDPSRLSSDLWEKGDDGVFTYKKSFNDASGKLTYDGINPIIAFNGLEFQTTGNDAGQIKFDTKNGSLILGGGVKLTVKDAPKDEYIRIEATENLKWSAKQEDGNANLQWTYSISNDGTKYVWKTGGTEANYNDCTIQIPTGGATIKEIQFSASSYAQLSWKDGNNIVKQVVKQGDDNPSLPTLEIKVNGVNRKETDTDMDNTTFWSLRRFSSSAPHVASIDKDGTVTITGVAGSAVITAELINEGNRFDVDHDADKLFESSNRIFAQYEIVTKPDQKSSLLIGDNENKEYPVGTKFTNEDKTVQVTLGGWKYTDTYYGKADSYTKKESWQGNIWDKSDASSYTEKDIFSELFTGNEHFSTNGANAANSERMKSNDVNDRSGWHEANTENESFANETPWTLPCRGSYIKIEPTAAGIISAYVMQEGCVSFCDNDKTYTGEKGEKENYSAGEPYDISVRRVYIADETGKIIKDVVAETKSKVAAQIWKEDGRSRAEYNYAPGSQELAYNLGMYYSYAKFDWGIRWDFLDNWPNKGMKQHVFLVKNGGTGTEAEADKGKDGHVIINKGIVRYTFNVLPGKTYYIFSNDSRVGFAGFTFDKNKRLKDFKTVEHKAEKYSEILAGGVETLTEPGSNVVFDDVLENGNGKNKLDVSLNDYIKLQYNRNFWKDKWSSICLPYSMSKRQVEENFGEGTQVILMNQIRKDGNDKIIQFIWHANQDIIAGYPYLILPKKDVTSITTTSAITETVPAFSVTEGKETKDYNFFESANDGYVFAGNFQNQVISAGSYVVANTGKLARATTEVTAKPFRAFLYNTSREGILAKELKSMSVSSWEDIDDNSGTSTSIDDVLFDSGILSKKADVYSVNGTLVRRNTHNMQGLPKGIYVVKGKKYVVK